jgi:transcriptional regulator with XRE-family HTH domain
MPIDVPRGWRSYRIGMADAPKGTGDAEFGTRLRKAREAAGLSQAQLGAEIGREQNTISDYETGSAMPEAKDLPRLAKAVGATRLDFLLEGPKADMPDDVQKTVEGLLYALPKRTWRKLVNMPPELRTQTLKEIAALLDAKAIPPPRPAKRRP